MDEGELEGSVFSATNMMDDFSKSSSSMESFLDELLKNTHACTHTHTCNPPGPDNTHTHTCFHTHTRLLAEAEEERSVDNSETQKKDSSKSKKRPLGNKEAVRKYREKKKAHTQYLEDEVAKLRAVNHHLIKRLHAQAGLECEVQRLKCLLADFRGRIDGELNSYPYQKATRTDKQDGSAQQLLGGYVLNAFHVPCDADVPCLHSTAGTKNNDSLVSDQRVHSQWPEGCNVITSNCQAANIGGASSCGLVTCSDDTMTNVVSTVMTSNKRKATSSMRES